jgi:hypothetical protein
MTDMDEVMAVWVLDHKLGNGMYGSTSGKTSRAGNLCLGKGGCMGGSCSTFLKLLELVSAITRSYRPIM